MKQLIFIVSIIVSNTCLAAGVSPIKVEISGQVKDQETKENLLYSKVLILNNKDSIIAGGITDEKGFFKIPVNPGQYKFVITSYGYVSDTLSTRMVREHIFLGVFKLNKNVLNLEEMKVLASSRTENLDKDVQVVTEALKKGATAAKDVLNRIAAVAPFFSASVTT